MADAKLLTAVKQLGYNARSKHRTVIGVINGTSF
jgi:hypothetical protein